MNKPHRPGSYDPAKGQGVAHPSAPGLAWLGEARARYAQEWSAGNAHRFAADNLYRWMAQRLPSPTTVLEIGTGDGRGTMALLAAGHTVIGLDENPACLRLAERRLARHRVPVIYETRETTQSAGDRYRTSYSMPVSPPPERGALLLESDILHDPELLRWLRNTPGIGTVTCWLMGTYLERVQNNAIAQLGIRTPWEYRKTVHRSVCAVANEILPAGGVLHFVDRGDLPRSEEDEERYRAYYGAQSAGSALMLDSLESIQYREPAPNAPTAVRLTSADTRDPVQAQTALISARCRRR